MFTPDDVKDWVRKTARFTALGVVLLLFSVTATAVLHEVVGLDERVSYAITLLLMITISFVACRWYVFPGSKADWRRQLAAFVLASLLFRGGEFLGFVALNARGLLPYPIAIVVVQSVSFCVKLTFYGAGLFQTPGSTSS